VLFYLRESSYRVKDLLYLIQGMFNSSKDFELLTTSALFAQQTFHCNFSNLQHMLFCNLSFLNTKLYCSMSALCTQILLYAGCA